LGWWLVVVAVALVLVLCPEAVGVRLLAGAEGGHCRLYAFSADNPSFLLTDCHHYGLLTV
jgi:hypothetical protein